MNKRNLIYYVISAFAYFFIVSLIVYFESNESGSNIKTFWDGIWYSLVTMTTVGYGDMYPISIGGRILSFVFLISSITLLGAVFGNVSNKIREMKEKKKMGHYGTNMEKHVVIIGWDSFAKSIIKILLEAGRNTVLISNKVVDIQNASELFKHDSFFAFHCDYTELEQFEKINISKAKDIFVNLDSDTENLVAILNMKSLYPDLRFIVILENERLKETFKSAGVTYVISKNEIASKLMASYLFEPEVAEFNLDLMSYARTEKDYDMQEYKVLPHNQFAGKKYYELFDYVHSNFRSLPVGISKQNSDGVFELIKLPLKETEVNVGDYVLFINNAASSLQIKKLFGIDEGMID